MKILQIIVLVDGIQYDWGFFAVFSRCTWKETNTNIQKNGKYKQISFFILIILIINLGYLVTKCMTATNQKYHIRGWLFHSHYLILFSIRFFLPHSEWDLCETCVNEGQHRMDELKKLLLYDKKLHRYTHKRCIMKNIGVPLLSLSLSPCLYLAFSQHYYPWNVLFKNKCGKRREQRLNQLKQNTISTWNENHPNEEKKTNNKIERKDKWNAPYSLSLYWSLSYYYDRKLIFDVERDKMTAFHKTA